MCTGENVKVSVVIPTYNRSTMLKRAIDSVLNQTYTNVEVIVVDDNNPDTLARQESEKVMSDYKNNEKVVYIKHDTNRNGSAARNTGLRESTGEVVCFLDDDDWYLKDKIQLQLNYLLKHKEFHAVYCGWKRRGKDVIPTDEGDLSFGLLSGTRLIYTNAIMIWKDVARKIGGWDEELRRNQEAAFLLRLFKNDFKIGVVRKVLVEFDVSDRSNALNAKTNKEQFDLYLQKYEDEINRCDEKIMNARKVIYSYRYRGIFFSFIKAKDFVGAIKVYFSMMKYIPIQFNMDLLKYTFGRIFSRT